VQRETAVVNASKFYRRLASNPSRIITFREFERLLEAAGFVMKRRKGSHRSYRHPLVPKILTIQPNGKDAKRYQVDEFMAMVEAYGVELDS
jgi:predicted RNA binding protein YcfA (HicA-like mRNA interferase family)